MKIRIKFAKYGALKFIGHLDIMRFFQKAIRRAGIDIKYTEGFHPHPVMSFAAPLGVGLESVGEYMDIEVNSITSTKQMQDALNRVMVEGISILSVKRLPDSVKNAMASVTAAKYRILYKNGEFPIEDMEQKISAFYELDKILVEKTTKKNVLELDLKPGIYELGMEKGTEDSILLRFSLAGGDKAGKWAFVMCLNASSSGNIKPQMVWDAFCSHYRITLPSHECQVIRTETYTDAFVPLEQMGYDSVEKSEIF